jgi:RNA polymerase sigma-70 factor, ECF subfamily
VPFPHLTVVTDSSPNDELRQSQRDTDAPDAREVTRLLHDLQQGAEGAADRLVPLVYGELHRLAVSFMQRERQDHTLQPTALVHDAYFRLVDQRNASWQNRSHFFAIAARAMRRILVDHARKRHAAKRDGGHRITLDESVAAADERSVELLALDEALTRLAALDERQARVVELRYFSGFSVEQTAEALGISRATANRDWTFARAFLQREMEAR